MALDWSWWVWLLGWLVGVGVRAVRALGVDPAILAAGLLLAVSGRAGSWWAMIALVGLAGVVGVVTFLAGPVGWLRSAL